MISTGNDITEARRRHEAMRGLEAVGQLLAEHGPSPAALDGVLDEMAARMGYRFLSLYLHDGSGLRLAAQSGHPAAPERLDAGKGIVGRAFRMGVAVFVPDIHSDPDYLPGDARDDSVAAVIAVPLLGDTGSLGVLNIESAGPEVVVESDMQFARTVADRLSISLAAARHRRRSAIALACSRPSPVSRRP